MKKNLTTSVSFIFYAKTKCQMIENQYEDKEDDFINQDSYAKWIHCGVLMNTH